MYEAISGGAAVQKDRSRLKLGLWITLAAVLLALTATPLVWASRQSAAYRRYMDALNGSVLYAREHDGVWLERAGSRVHYPSAGRGRYQRKAPAGRNGKAPAGAAGGRGCDPGLRRRQSSAAVGGADPGRLYP